MGNKVYIVKSADNSVFNPNVSLEQQLEPMGGQSFPHIGRIELYKSRRDVGKNATIFEKRHANTATDDEGPLINLHEQLIDLKHPNLIKYYGLCIDPELTTNAQMSRWFYEALFRSLKSVTGYHFSNKSLIPERELWKILHQIVSGLHFLESRQKWHTHIQPDSIYLDQHGSIKLIPKGVLRNLSGYQVVQQKRGQALLSPQQVESLKQKLQDPTHDIARSDVFSLGMTFLELLTLKDSFECYNYDTPDLNEQLVEERFNEASNNGYSSDLLNLVGLMLQKDEELRPDWLLILNSNEMNENLANSRNTPLKSVESISSKNVISPPSIPPTTTQFQQPSPIRIQSQVAIPQYLPNQFQQPTETDRVIQEQILREQQIQTQLQLQLKQQQQLLQQQQQQQQQQQLLIEQQQQQLSFYQKQLQQLQSLLPQQQVIEEPKEQPKRSDYLIHPLPTPPLTLNNPPRNTIDDFKESAELKNRVNQALALSRQAIDKYSK